MKRALLIGLIATAAGLAACGGSSSGGYMAATPSPADTPPMPDAFFALVQGQISTTSEDKEPVAIDAIVATSPEGDEPATI